MAFEEDGQTYYDTQPTGENNTTVNYIDPTDVPEIADEIKNGVVGNVEQGVASWIRNEMGRKHVREALARSVEYFSVLFNKQKAIIDSNTAKQNNVEQRQSKLERDFITRISNATVNSEVINARQSDVYGQFNVLDLRVENIESIMSNFVPSGFIVKINHNLNKNPTVTVKKYDWAIGTETNGFDTAPDGLFGGGAIEIVPTNLIYDDGIVYVHMPLVYKQNGKFILKSDTELLLIDGTHTLNFEFEGGLIDGTISDEPTNDIPITHTAYAYSADGTDRFTTVYPKLNLLTDSKDFINKDLSGNNQKTSIVAPNSTVKKDGNDTYLKFISTADNQYWLDAYLVADWSTTPPPDFINTNILPNSKYTFSFWAKGNGEHTANSYDKWTTPSNMVFTFTLTNEWKYYSFTVTSSATIPVKNIEFFLRSLATGTEINLKYPKVEQGSTATSWMPSSSELPTTDGPRYIGQYTDFTKVGSTNPSDYTWIPIPITYTAWAYSADGTDRFTTTYPNLNLLDGTRDFSGTWGNSSSWVTDGTYKDLTVKKRTGGQWNGIYKTFTVSKDGNYTFSAYVKSSGNNANIYRYFFLDGVNINTYNKLFGNNFDWTRDSVTLNLKANDIISIRYEISSGGTDSILWVAGYKLEQGSIATPWMPSSSEVKPTDYPRYIGQHTDFMKADSKNPSDYNWRPI